MKYKVRQTPKTKRSISGAKNKTIR